MYNKKPADIAKFYKNNRSKEKEYFAAVVARPTPDDTQIELTRYFNFHSRKKSLVTIEEFTKSMEQIDALPPPGKKTDLPDDITLITTARGLPIIVADDGMPRRVTAPYDGVVMDSGQTGYLYLSNYELTSVFNYAGQKNATHPEITFRDKTAPLIKGILLDKDITLSIPTGTETIPAGSFITADGNGGFAIHPPEYANLALRKKPGDNLIISTKDKVLKFLRLKH